jgi:L-asparaginase / beta-aspartyl-peptidase
MEPVVVVQGGAGDIPRSRVHGKLRGVRQAAQLGYYTLMHNGSALDAVEAAVKHMELDDVFNTGYGAVLTTEGTVELEASVMDGKTLKAGCVTGVVDIMHPITAARRVMEKTPHNFLGFHGANRFIKQQHDFELLQPGALVTDYAKEALEDWKSSQKSGGLTFAKTEIGHGRDEKGDTVGAVAIDQYGNIAVATSTGGITGKLPGRIGDTPVLGGGTYCDNRFGGVSTTGHGETIMKACLAHDIIKRMEYLGEDAQTATSTACKNMTDRFIGTGGAITVDHKGNVGVSFTSKRMVSAIETMTDSC